MKAMILAAGKSSRLKRNKSKVLMSVLGKTILEHNLLYLKKEGVREIVINLHYQGKQIENYLNENRKFGMKIHYSHESRLLGTAGGVKKVERIFNKKDFLILYGDNLCDFNIRQLKRDHGRNRALVTLGVFNPKSTAHSGILSGLISLDEKKRVRRFVEKRNNRKLPAGVVNGGVGIYSPQILKWIPAEKPYDFSKNLYPKLLRSKKRIQTSEAKVSYVLASDTRQALAKTRRLASKLIKGDI